MTNDVKKDNPIAIANRSGFPFQCAIESVTRRSKEAHGWSVLSTEHGWFDTDKNGHFADLVLGAERFGGITGTFLRYRAVIECKRANDALVFLMPSRAVIASGARLYFNDYRAKVSSWVDSQVIHSLSQSQLCAVRTRDTIESWCREVLNSVVSISEEPAADPEKTHILGAVFFAIIVTTASLSTLVFDPDKVSLEDGTLATPTEDYGTAAKWVNFSKDFGMELLDFDGEIRPRHQSVFIVQAPHYEEFLSKVADLRYGLMR